MKKSRNVRVSEKIDVPLLRKDILSLSKVLISREKKG